MTSSIHPANVSIIAIMTRLGFPAPGKVAAALVGIALVAFVYRCKPSLIDIGGIAICGAILFPGRMVSSI